MQKRVVAAVVSAAALAIGSVQAANATVDDSSLGERELLIALDAVPDEFLTIPDLAIRPNEDALTVRLPVSADDDAVIYGPNGTLSIGLPFKTGTRAELRDGLAGFDHGNGSWSVPIAQPDGSVQIAAVIESAAAPTEYRYSLSLPAGAEVRDIDGLVTFWNAAGTFLGGVAPAWALDAKGEVVPTSFRVEGNTLVQHVDHGKASAYPVVADPWLGINLFQGLSTSTQSGDIRYNFSRTSWGVSVHTGLAQGGGAGGLAAGIAIMQSAGWDELRTPWPAITNKATLRQQYDCHVVGGYFEGQWNLERFRANFSNWLPTSLSHQCNW